MAFTHKVSDKFSDKYGAFTEVVEDEALASRLAAGDSVAFHVIEDEWNETFTHRTIKRAEIVDGE